MWKLSHKNWGNQISRPVFPSVGNCSSHDLFREIVDIRIIVLENFLLRLDMISGKC